MFDSVITAIQQAVMSELIETYGHEYDFLAPRYVEVPAHVRERDEWAGYGPVLLLIGAPDPLMDDCDCDESHVLYSAIRSDGQSTEPITSGTLFEHLIVPPDAQWDNAHAVTPNMWPVPNVPDTIPGM
jgi:hypothetical protein